MVNFQYYNPARIVFGPGSERELANLLRMEQASALLLIYSGEFIRNLGIYQVVEDACRELNIPFSANGQAAPNPEISLVRELILQGRETGVDFVRAGGGGSSIDTAKAVAMGIPYDGDPWDFFTGDAVPEQVLPVGAIPTISSSGSETSNCAILSNGRWKLGYEDDRIIPRFAIMNPLYTVGLSAYQTAVGVADVLTHLLERYFSDTRHTDVTDYLIEGAIRALLVNGRRLIDHPEDVNARAELQWLASVAHNNFLDAGRVADWGAHRIEHELSAQYGITHGEGMAVVTVAWTRYIAKEKPWRLAMLARRVFDVEPCNHTEEESALILSEKLRQFFHLLNLRTSLTSLGIGTDAFEEMTQRATRNGTVGHYVPLDAEKIQIILHLALEQI